MAVNIANDMRSTMSGALERLKSMRGEKVLVINWVLILSSLGWGIYFAIWEEYDKAFVSLTFIPFPLLGLFLKSKYAAVNIMNLGQVISVVEISYLSGSCHTHLRTLVGIIIIFNVILLRDMKCAFFWTAMCCVVGITMSLDIVCIPHGDFFTPSFIVLANLTYAIFILIITLLCERDRTTADLKRSSFMSSLSHELRTPLNGILCAAELLLEREDLKEEEAENALIVFGCGQRMSSLVDNILDSKVIHPGECHEGIENDLLFNVVEV